MLIYVNGRFLTKTVTGVARYALETMRQFDVLLDRVEYTGVRIVCLTPPEPVNPPGWKNIQVRSVGVNHQNLWEQVDLLFHARGHLLFSPGNSGPVLHSRQVVTIHETSVFAYPWLIPQPSG